MERRGGGARGGKGGKGGGSWEKAGHIGCLGRGAVGELGSGLGASVG